MHESTFNLGFLTDSMFMLTVSFFVLPCLYFYVCVFYTVPYYDRTYEYPASPAFFGLLITLK